MIKAEPVRAIRKTVSFTATEAERAAIEKALVQYNLNILEHGGKAVSFAKFVSLATFQGIECFVGNRHSHESGNPSLTI